MSNPKPAQFSWVSPYIIVKDVDQSIDFYTRAFGFKLKEKVPGENGTTTHAELFYKDQIIMLGKEGAYEGKALSPSSSNIESPMSLYLYIENIDDFYKNSTQSGAISVSPPEEMFWGDRMCRLKCPDNYIWAFATNIAECPNQSAK